MKSLMRFANLLLLLLTLCSCQTFRTSDVPLIVRLPASRQCFEIKIMSKAEKLYSPADCDKIVARAVLLTSEGWKMLRSDIQTNCQTAQCKQIQGAADGLFLTIDKALQTIP